MIVLDATNKSLVIKAKTGSLSLNGTVVSYWSIISNVWTPKSFELAPGSVTPIAIEILPAPASGEIRVVENVWMSVNNAGGDLEIYFKVATVLHLLAEFNNSALSDQIITLGRDGKFTRQEPNFVSSNPVGMTQNVH